MKILLPMDDSDCAETALLAVVVRHAPCSVEVVRTPNGSASNGEQVLT